MIEMEKPVYKDSLTKQLRNLLAGMMQKNETKRLTMGRIRGHKWVTDDGKSPLISTKENCLIDDSITEEEFESALKPTRRPMTHVTTTLNF